MIVYDVSDPFEPKRIGHFDSGGLGVHRIVYRGGRFAYVSAIPEGFDSRIWVVVDLADPEHPVEVRSYHAESVLHGAITGEVEYSEAMVLFFDAAYDALAPGELTPDPGAPDTYVDERLDANERRNARDAVGLARDAAHAAYGRGLLW